MSQAIELLHQRRSDAGGDGGASEAQQDFQRDPAGLETCKAVDFAAAEKYGFADRGGGARCWKTKGFNWWIRHFVPEASGAGAGVLTRRAPNEREAADIAYGLGVARQIAAMDIGPDGGGADRACVAVEAMEGTDETMERAARFARAGRWWWSR